VSGPIAAWEQVASFWALLVAGWWLMRYPHDDDGVEYPYIRLCDRPTLVHGLARRIDPGMRVGANPQLDGEVAS
jgi:hypothetical protein